MNARIAFTLTKESCTFQLLNGANTTLPFTAWAGHDVGAELGVAVLASFEQAGNARVDASETGVMVESPYLALLDDQRAAAIGLPPPVPFTLQIDARGALGRMRLDTSWIDDGKLRIRDASTTGVLLRAKGKSYRLASPLFEILRAVETFNAQENPSTEEQLAGWAGIRELIGIQPDHITTRGFVDRLRVARATRFTLEFVSEEGGEFQIAPVPLALDHRRTQNDESEETAQSNEETVRLLASAEEARFQRSFRAKHEVQTSYVGGDGTYVLFAPEVLRSLEVVRRVQDSPVTKRLEFARNPFLLLRDTAASDEEIPFIESRSFSDRVIGIGLLEKPTLPWQILNSQGWLPPEFVPVRIADREYAVTPAAIAPAIVDIEHAMSHAQPNVTVEGQEIQATPLARDAFLEARKSLDMRAELEAATEPSLPPQPRERVGLQTKRNLDAAEFVARRSERSPLIPSVPEIATMLKSHQQEALAWLQGRWANGHRGALLADDMGLGKTLSALAFMMWLRRGMLDGRIAQKPMLIVAPVSLLENWKAEHERHIGEYEVRFQDIVPAYGTRLPRNLGRDDNGRATGSGTLNLDRLTQDRFGKPTCVLTTYETLRDYQQSFASVSFGLVVLDEAQRIKNPASLSWSSVSTLNGDFWLALSGTPVENRLADLWAITDAIEPGLLGSLREFSALYEKGFDEHALRRLKDLLETSSDGFPFMMRRLKDNVRDGLPTKTSSALALPMPKVQETAYSAVISDARGMMSKKHILEVIQQMREISLHPHLMEMNDAQAYIAASARFQLLFQILDAIYEKGEKALIFVDRNIVEEYLALLIQKRYHLDQLPAIINGEVPGPKRQVLVKRFQDAGRGFDVMVLSPKAGGVGLTLTAANHVIHLSRWWNPAVEDQATDRVYRIGQKKPVFVYSLQAVLADQPGQSFDERLHALLQKKRTLSRDLLWPFQSDESDVASLLGQAFSEETG